MKVSVIIPTFDRPNTLRQVIDSYLIQNKITELIIIDDGSSKSYSETNEYIKSKIDIYNIKYIYHKNKTNMGAAYCRNLGVSLSNCEYILWGEDDAFLSENYIDVLSEKINNKTIVMGSIYYGITPWMAQEEKNQIIFTQQSSNKNVFDMKSFEGYYRKKTHRDIEVPFGHALILVPKCAYKDISYYEKYRVNGYREESDAQVQMIRNGYKIIYTSETECYHFPGYAIESGGQHKSFRIKQELYTIINTFIFYNRHYDFLKRRYNLHTTIYGIKLNFFVNRVAELSKRILNKF